MNKNNLLIIVLFIGYVHCNIFAQKPKEEDNTDYRKIIPPSPSVSAMEKSADIANENYTGKVSVNIPLWTLKSRNLQLPLSLSYSTGGVQVGEQSGWIGLGWSLSGEPIVSRTVVGFPDESTRFGLHTGSLHNQLLRDKYSDEWEASGSFININKYDDGRTTSGFLINACEGYRDTQHDIFSFSIGGYSGEFYILYSDEDCENDSDCDFFTRAWNRDNIKVILNPFHDIGIKVIFDEDRPGGDIDDIYNQIIGFEFILPDGSIYMMDEPEQTYLSIVDFANYDYYSAWHASKIYNPEQSESISFGYETIEELRQNLSYSKYHGEVYPILLNSL